MRWVSRLVTIGVVAAVLGGFALLIWSGVPDAQIGERFVTYTKFRDASRLAVGSPVVIAGVRIGDITKLSIEGQFARVDMRLQDDVEIPADSFVTKRADSLFGDSYLEIIPSGDESAPLLRSGEPLRHVQEGNSTDAVLRSIARAMPKIDSALELVHEFMINGRQWVQGPLDNRLQDAAQWLTEGHIESPLSRAYQALGRLEDGTEAAAEAVASARPDVDARLRGFDDGVRSARTSIADVQTGIVDGLRDAREGMDRIDPTVQQLAEVMTAIDRGEGEDWRGTLGTLVNDPELADSLEDGSEAVREGVAGFNRFKAWLGGRLELGMYSRSFRFYATAELRSRNDKFYLIELERSALGGAQTDSLSEVANTDDYIRRQEIRDELRFTAQFGKQFGFLQVRGGVKDSTFGIGADALFLDGRLRFSADVFGSFFRTPRVKLAGALAVFRSIYVLAGVDDALNEPGSLNIVTGNTDVPNWFNEMHYGRDYFVGAALQFDDQDLSTLLRLYGALLVGLL